MAEAILRIQVEGGNDIRRALGQVGASSRQANTSMAGDARTAARVILGVWRDASREREREGRRFAEVQRGGYRQAAQEAKRSADEQVRIDRDAAERRARTNRDLHAEMARDERARTRAMAAENEKRARDAERSARESRARIARIVSAGLSMGADIAGDLHQQRQAARVSRAEREHSMNSAFSQAGATVGDAAALRARVYGFARANGMDSAQLAEALNRAQGDFSILGGSRSTQGQRVANLDSALQDALFARNTFQDPGEVMRISGMLGSSGMDSATRRRTLLALTGFAQQGAIELGAVTRTAMAPMQARIGQALGALPPSATEEQRQAAVQRSVAQTFAEMEVGRGLGYSPRMMGNIMQNMGAALSSPVMQQKMLTNIRNALGRNSEAERTLFENDHGRMRLRSQFTDALGLSEGLSQAFHGDATQMRNVFAGGGHGNPQSLQANWRNALAAFMGQDVEGVTGADRVRRMIAGAGTAFTEADVQRGAAIAESETQTELNRNQESHDAALVDNTSELAKVSDALNRWNAEHPVAGTVARVAGPALLGAVPGLVSRFFGGGPGGAGGGAGGILGRVGTALVGGLLSVPGMALGGTAAAGLSLYSLNRDVNRATGTTMLERIGAGLDTSGALTAQLQTKARERGRAFFQIEANDRLQNTADSLRGTELGDRLDAAANRGGFTAQELGMTPQQLMQGLIDAQREGLAHATIVARIEPQDVVHARSQAPVPPPDR